MTASAALSRCSARGARHGDLRVVREALAVQLLARRSTTTAWARRAGIFGVPEQRDSWRSGAPRSAPSSSSATAYLLEKTRGLDAWRPFVRLMAVLPMGVPGMVLGLGYIFFFVRDGNPLHFLYGTHGDPVSQHRGALLHVVAPHGGDGVEADRQRVRGVSASLKVPFWRTFFRVTVPVCLPAMLDISRYLFVNAMTTVSAVVFLYSPNTCSPRWPS
jgi:hypothetical protein